MVDDAGSRSGNIGVFGVVCRNRAGEYIGSACVFSPGVAEPAAAYY